MSWDVADVADAIFFYFFSVEFLSTPSAIALSDPGLLCRDCGGGRAASTHEQIFMLLGCSQMLHLLRKCARFARH
jgi:hypothetical protein